MTLIFNSTSDDGNFRAAAEDHRSIFLRYEPVNQQALLPRSSAVWLKDTIVHWQLSFFKSFGRVSPSGDFAVLAEDDRRIWIWYETLGQGVWMPRQDALWLKTAIYEWALQTREQALELE